MMPSLDRFKVLMPAILANVVTVFSTLFYQWNMLEVTMIYCWEFLIIATLTHIKILNAKGTFKTKLITFLVAFLMYGIFLSASFSALYIWFSGQLLSKETHFVISVCSLLFLYDHCSAYYKESKAGIYNSLPSDNELMIPMFRILPLYILMPLLIMNHINGISYSIEQFMLGLVIIAIINVAMHIVHYDRVKNKMALINVTS